MGKKIKRFTRSTVEKLQFAFQEAAKSSFDALLQKKDLLLRNLTIQSGSFIGN